LQTTTYNGMTYQYVCNMGNNLVHQGVIDCYLDLLREGNKGQICKVFEGDVKDFSGHFCNKEGVFVTGRPYGGDGGGLASTGCGNISNTIKFLSDTCGYHGGKLLASLYTCYWKSNFAKTGSASAAMSEGGSEMVVHVNDHWV